MPRQSRARKSTRVPGHRIDRLAKAREIVVKERDSLLAQARTLDQILERMDSALAPDANLKKSLRELFDARDRTQVGSTEEAQAAEKILEAVFPDTNAS